MYFLNLWGILATLILFAELPWAENLDHAKQIAKAENKLILLVFSGSDWCRNCILLHRQVFYSVEFEQLAEESLVLLKADFPRKRKNQLPQGQQTINKKLAEKFNQQGEFPKVVLMDSQEKVLFESGYQQDQKSRFIETLRAHIDE